MTDVKFCEEMIKQAEFALMVCEQLPVETAEETLERARGNFERLKKEWEVERDYWKAKEPIQPRLIPIKCKEV